MSAGLNQMLSAFSEILALFIEVSLQHFLCYRSGRKTSLNIVLGHNALYEDGNRDFRFVHWCEADEPSNVQFHIVVSPLPRASLACDGDSRDFNASSSAY